MTKIESINKALKLWKYIDDNGFGSKITAYEFLGLDRDENNCPFCEYVTKNYPDERLNCTKCPAYGYWGTEDDQDSYFCESVAGASDTVYDEWYFDRFFERKAIKMVDLIKKVKKDNENN